MVSVTQLEDDCPFLKPNTSSEQSKCHQLALRGIRTHLYLFGAPEEGNDDYTGFSCSFDEQSLLESLILSQWEDCACKGRVSYDVTACEMKIIDGGEKFIAQLNEKWNPYSFTEFENKALQPSGLIKWSYMRAHREDILFCMASGVKETSELIPATTLPKDGILILVNANPLEYGHIFLVPYGVYQRRPFFDGRTFEMVTKMVAEVNSCSFCIFYDYNASAKTNPTYFQATYFADPLPVELLPTVPVHGSSVEEGIHICEIERYPLKALVFMSRNLNAVAEVVAEICSTLKERNTAFSLLISDRGKKMFLFPQVGEQPLSTWECGGYFVYDKESDYNVVSEMEIFERMASVSLDDKCFRALKQLCCDTASRLLPP